VRAEHHTLGSTWLTAAGDPALLFTENESNAERLWGQPSRNAAVKDAFHEAIVGGNATGLAPAAGGGTKTAAHYAWTLAPGETRIADLRLTQGDAPGSAAGDHEAIFTTRRAEADTFYGRVTPDGLSDDERLVQRQAFAGLIWGKQYYHVDVARWLDGDPAGPPPPAERISVAMPTGAS